MVVETEDAHKIADIVLRRLDSQRTVDIETHRKHHEYIDLLILEKEKVNARKEQWIRVVGGWGLILILSALATASWQYIKKTLE